MGMVEEAETESSTPFFSSSSWWASEKLSWQEGAVECSWVEAVVSWGADAWVLRLISLALSTMASSTRLSVTFTFSRCCRASRTVTVTAVEILAF